MGKDMTFVFVQKRKGRRKKELEDVSDYSLEDGVLTVEHSAGPDTTFTNVNRLDAAYRGNDPEYAKGKSGEY